MTWLSRSRTVLAIFLLPSVLTALPADSQDLLTAVPFEAIPDSAAVQGGGEAIGLAGDTEVGGDLDATGEVSSETGFRFPDGSLQVTAGGGSCSDSGVYDNRIPDFSPPNAYTEVCLKGGAVEYDIHSGGEPTTGGDCLPGDIGWVIERFERGGGAPQRWFGARHACLLDGMRLPEPYEFQLSCDHSDFLAVNDMSDGWEWSSNESIPLVSQSGNAGVATSILGSGSCYRGSWGWVGRSNLNGEMNSFRCVR